MLHKERQDSTLKAGLSKQALNLCCEILDIRISGHGNVQVVGDDGHGHA